MKGKAFVDSGCSFNAISSSYSSRCGLKTKIMEKNIICAVGGGNTISIERRVAECTFNLNELGNYKAAVFVMDSIPMNCDAIFGTVFLKQINPQIDWRNLSTKPAPVEQHGKTSNDVYDPQHRELMNYHMTHELVTPSGGTTVIRQQAFEQELAGGLTDSPEEFFFVLRPIVASRDTEKTQRYKEQGWDQLQSSPALPILLKYRDTVFRDNLNVANVVQESTVTHRIDLVDNVPIKVKQFRLSPEQQKAVVNWTEEMLAAGLIKESTSPYASPIFCIKKPVGWRIVHDYRLLNAKTRIPQEPIPRKDDIIDAMQGGYWFSCMDLLSGYYQLLLDKTSRACTAFSTPKGHFEYLVMAQGLAGAPATFNRFVQQVFVGLEEVSRAFFDDMYVFTRSRDMDAHLGALDNVLGRCAQYGLSIKLSKCVFCSPEIPVLGDFVGRTGVRMDPDKVAVIKSWPLPKNRQQLKSFLGTITYCARFCKDYGKLVAPLHQATKGRGKHEAVNFTEFQIKCFEDLKLAMSRTPTLALADFTKPFGIRMDASDFAIGGVLFQLDDQLIEHPIAYTGRKLSQCELLYPVREKELLAIVHALRIWRPYLLDKPFVVETDHQTLQELLTQRTCTQRLARWLNLISEYRPEFRWIPGETNATADGLSRRCDFFPEDGPASSVSMRELLQSILATEPTEHDIEDASTQIQFTHCDQALMVFELLSSRDVALLCRENYPKDEQLKYLWEFFLKGGQERAIPQHSEKYIIREGLLWKKSTTENLRLCIPNNKELRKKVLFSEHDDPARGHPGVYKTMKNVQRKYYWANMISEIKEYVATCEKCQRNKYRQSRPPGLLNTLPIPEARWQDITMDFILSLPKAQNYNSIWVIVDRLTKRAHFIPIEMGSQESTAKACAAIFQREYQRLHGIPESIISDRDVRFTSAFWRELMALQGIVHNLSSAFRPQTDGQTERTNRFIEDYIRNYVHASQENWPELLWSAEFAYNARVHESIKMSPFEADLGYIPRAIPDRIFDDIVGKKSHKDIFTLGRKQQQIMKILKENLAKAHERMRKYYNRNRPVQEFDVGSKVMVSTKNLNIEHLGIPKSGTTKFGPLWIGPYPIIEKTSPDTYKLLLPIGLKLHTEFHTSLLKPYLLDPDSERFNLPNEGMLSAGGNNEKAYLIEDVVSHRKEKGIISYLVKWLGYPTSENSWEPLSEIKRPASRLIDTYLERRGLNKNSWNPDLRSSRTKRKFEC
jgi:RNase H-like domain found in reverse transcriptase/Integrase zinc binding domain/Reverse transcriptase (RNA-dependent DNA polymerase)/Chromo (CHRromatin Organisation MOdifier) domain